MSDVGSRESSLVATFVELTDVLVDDFDVVELLTYLAGRCVEVLGVDAAGMMLASPTGTLQAVASSSEAVRTLELFELQTRQGPCYECFYNATPLANVSLSDALERWPDFAPLALDAGFRSATALRCTARAEVGHVDHRFLLHAGQCEASNTARQTCTHRTARCGKPVRLCRQ